MGVVGKAWTHSMRGRCSKRDGKEGQHLLVGWKGVVLHRQAPGLKRLNHCHCWTPTCRSCPDYWEHG